MKKKIIKINEKRDSISTSPEWAICCPPPYHSDSPTLAPPWSQSRVWEWRGWLYSDAPTSRPCFRTRTSGTVDRGRSSRPWPRGLPCCTRTCSKRRKNTSPGKLAVFRRSSGCWYFPSLWTKPRCRQNGRLEGSGVRCTCFLYTFQIASHNHHP